MDEEPISQVDQCVGKHKGSDGECKSKRKRTITEARRKQNRLAQKSYRQRQKEMRQQAKAQAKDQSGLRKQRELLPRGDGAVNPQSPSNQLSFLPSFSALDENFHEPMALTWLEDAVLSTSPLPSGLASLPVTKQSSLIEVNHQLALPDPHANSLEFFETTIFSAVLHNALALGFSLASIADCGMECMSPFYRPATPQTNPEALLASALSDLAVEPPAHLRPTLAQVLIPHHASLDLIPLPHLRDRAIMLSAAIPTVFNIWELKADVYERGGLVIFKGNSRGGRGRQPWRKESWVAAPWFLRKWSMCLEPEKDQLCAHLDV